MKLRNFIDSLLYFLAFFIPFHFKFEIKGAVLSLIDILVLLLFFLVLIEYFLSPKKVNFSFLLLFGIFYLFSIPSRLFVLAPKNFYQGLWHILRNLVDLYPLIFIIFLFHSVSGRSIKKLVIILIISSSLSSLVGIIQTLSNGKYLTGKGVYGNLRYLGFYPPYPRELYVLERETVGKVTIVTHTPGTNIFRAHGGITSHNHFGAFLVLTSILTFSLAIKAKSLIIPFALQLIALFFTFSRASLVGFFVGIVVFIFLKRKFRFLFFGFCIVVIVLLLFAFFFPNLGSAIPKRISTILNPLEAVEMKARIKAWNITITKISKNPFFGYGIGVLEEFKLFDTPLTSHNDFLNIIYSRGIISFSGLLLLFFLSQKKSFYLYKNHTDYFIKNLSLGVFSGFIGFFVNEFAQVAFQIDTISPLIWTMLGIICSINEKRNSLYDLSDQFVVSHRF